MAAGHGHVFAANRKVVCAFDWAGGRNRLLWKVPLPLPVRADHRVCLAYDRVRQQLYVSGWCRELAVLDPNTAGQTLGVLSVPGTGNLTSVVMDAYGSALRLSAHLIVIFFASGNVVAGDTTGMVTVCHGATGQWQSLADWYAKCLCFFLSCCSSQAIQVTVLLSFVDGAGRFDGECAW